MWNVACFVTDILIVQRHILHSGGGSAALLHDQIISYMIHLIFVKIIESIECTDCVRMLGEILLYRLCVRSEINRIAGGGNKALKIVAVKMVKLKRFSTIFNCKRSS